MRARHGRQKEHSARQRGFAYFVLIAALPFGATAGCQFTHDENPPQLGCAGSNCPCPPEQERCGADEPICADLQTDPAHCGACDNECPDGFACLDGVCDVACGGEYDQCSDDDGRSYCTSLAQDPHHCGACDVACSSGSLCFEGECTASCAEGYTACGDDGDGHPAYCADLFVDLQNCGECGKACATGFLCSDGDCTASCADGYSACGDDGEGHPTYCADLSGDRKNCGECGTACDAGYTCIGSRCVLSCVEGDTTCSAAEAEYCADLLRDGGNCGECGKACATGFLCSDGDCTASCAEGYTACREDGAETPSYCARLSDDAKNCNSCGAACGSGFSCSQGRCTASCAEDYTACPLNDPSFCADLSRDARNCGDCGDSCPEGFMCSGGTCAASCAEGYTACAQAGDEMPTYCARLTDDTHNCGACGQACGPEQACVEGICQCTSSNPDLCGSLCTNVELDPENCGICGVGCPAGFVCNGSGTCELSCQAGLRECTGVCVDVLTDRANCGGCGQPCADGFVCDGSGHCESSCQSGLHECAGICVDTDYDPRHCGACNVQCSAGHACDGSGECVLSCQDTLENCDGACVDLNVDPAHCGSCGAPCAEDEVCLRGDCVPASECSSDTTACNGTCVDTRFDPENCGGCGVRCADGQVCSQNACEDRCLDSTLCGTRCTDLDIDPRNCGTCGRECAAEETCVDGDCTEGLPTGPRCQSTLSIPLNAWSAFPPEAPPFCQLVTDDSGNAMGRMEYVLGTGDGPYASCVFANGVNLDSFDADNAAAGVLEVEFCADQETSGEVNLWYGAFPTRKKIELLRPTETMEAGSCLTVRRAPEQAVCHWTAHTDWANDCSRYTGVGYDSRCTACGSQCNQGCPITFSSTRLTFTAEQATIAQPTTAVLTLKSVRLLPSDCTCTGDSQCAESPDRTACESGLFSSSLCPNGAPICGVCVPQEPSCAAPLTLCGDECVDPLNDDEHCGGCDTPCSLPASVAACVGGECRLVDCASGVGDADGDEANGCECTITNGGNEACDGVDNDCDGLTDFVLQPDPRSTCDCDSDVPIDTPCSITVQSTTCAGTWQCRDGMAVCEVVSCP